jgi:hypothetical protein
MDGAAARTQDETTARGRFESLTSAIGETRSTNKRFTIANPKFSFPDISGTPEKEINLPGRRGQSRSRNIPPEIKSARTEIREIKSTQKIRKSKYPRPKRNSTKYSPAISSDFRQDQPRGISRDVKAKPAAQRRAEKSARQDEVRHRGTLQSSQNLTGQSAPRLPIGAYTVGNAPANKRARFTETSPLIPRQKNISPTIYSGHP